MDNNINNFSNNKGIGQIPLEEIKTFGQAKEKIQ